MSFSNFVYINYWIILIDDENCVLWLYKVKVKLFFGKKIFGDFEMSGWLYFYIL